MGRMARPASLQMSDQLMGSDPTGLGGDIAPTGFWDPAGLSNDKDSFTLKQWREAEIKHGRVCMLASVGLLTQELLKNPLGIDGPAIRHLDLIDVEFPEFGEFFILGCAFIEAYTILNFWEKRSDTRELNRPARLLDTSEPGNYGWDPLGWYPEDPEQQQIIRTKEIQNGRLAMLGVAGIVAQELADGKEVLCHFQKVCN
jgi:light-harvesting complex I chlorophyll a/b binding protein 1